MFAPSPDVATREADLKRRFIAIPAATAADWARNREWLIDEVLIQGAAFTPGVTPEVRRAYASFF